MAEITENKNFIHAFIEEDLGEGGQFAGYQVHMRTAFLPAILPQNFSVDNPN